MALVIGGLISYLHWPEAAFPITVLLLALALIAAVRLQYRLDFHGPRILLSWYGTGFTSLRIREDSWVRATGEHAGSVHKLLPDAEIEVCQIRIRNEPPRHHPDATVTDAIVRVGFYSMGDPWRPVVDSNGRWAGNRQAIDLEPYSPTDEVVRRSLPPNGEDHVIDIAFRYKSDGEAFALGNSFWNSAGGRPPGDRLSDRRYLVKATIKGTGLPSTWEHWFTLDIDEPCPPVGDHRRTLNLTPLETWQNPTLGLPRPEGRQR
ncbi:MAG: hypothetical protein ABI635_06150 [Actinomycetota bacterium]